MAACVLWVLACLASVPALVAQPKSPEQQVTIGPDGGFLDADGRPRCLIGSQLSLYSLVHQFKLKEGAYPPEYRYIYKEQPAYETMGRVGFNTMCSSDGPVWLRALSPDYAGYSTERPIQDAHNEFVLSTQTLRGNRLYTPEAFGLYAAFLRDLRLPIYIECTISSARSIAKDAADLQRLVGGPEAVSSFDSSSAFFLHYSLGVPEGRQVYLKRWRYAAEEIKHEGGQVLAYEIFNEPKYNDPSPANRARFVAMLKKKYGTIRKLNQTYRSSYADFSEVAGFRAPYAHDYPGLAVDWGKFMQDLVVGICEEGKRTIREVDPSARIAVQVHGMEHVLRCWHNFDVYRLAKVVDVLNTGTGGFPSCDAEGPDDDALPTVDTPNVSRTLRTSLLNARVWAALADGKPLLDGELYTGQTYGTTHSRIWGDVIRGHNATYLYTWQGAGGSEADALRAPFALLNPHYFKPEGFRAIADAADEIQSLADFVLPRANRPRADAALLVSYPTIRYDFACHHSGRHSGEWTGSAVALTFSHVPFDAVFEEQLPGKDMSRYRVLFADNVTNTYPGTVPKLRAYVENGGVLVANVETLDTDEYGNSVDQPLFDLRTEPLEGKVARLARLGVQAKPARQITASDGWTTVDSLADQPAILKRRCGKGMLYYIAVELPDYSLAAVYQEILNAHAVEPIGLLQKENEDEAPANVEIHQATHDGMVAWYFMNCDSYPKLVRFTNSALAGCRALDPFRKKSLAISGNTLTVLLPSQVRTVVVTGPAASLTRRFGQYPLLALADLQAEKAAMDEERAKVGKPVKPGRCLDLRTFCNRGFDNQQNWPVGSAWFDAKHKYLIGVPWHSNVFDGVKCQVIRMDFNNNRTCIALASESLPDGAKEVRGIAVGEKVRSISFFQAVTHGKLGETAMTYRIEYGDGSELQVPVVVGESIGDWDIERNGEQMRRLVAWRNPQGLGFFRWEWTNPQPQKEIVRLAAVSAVGQSTPIVVAITTHPADKPVGKLGFEGWTLESGDRSTDSGREVFRGGIALAAPDGKRLPIPREKMAGAFIRYSINTRPDEWGHGKKAGRTSVKLSGRLADGNASSTSAMGVYQSSNISKSCVELDADPETWQEISLPLRVVLAGHPGGTIVDITKLKLSANQTDLIRDLRVEYEDE